MRQIYMRYIKVARRYGKALLSAAIEQKVLSEVREDTRKILNLIKTSQEFNDFITNPIIQPQFKQEIFQQILGDIVHPLILNFLYLLAQRQRERLLEMIIQEFLREANEYAGIMIAHVTSVVPLTNEQETQLSQRLSAYSGKQIQLEREINEQIKGGFIIRLGDTIFDGSVATQLERLRKSLTMGLSKSPHL
ncbi:TPA: ATP synthase F1 subunit delta [Candidatus Poribacteria bacterium]|nr:ATP synthase F1 subunit delta [Candidatus Poribacteria bacterium]